MSDLSTYPKRIQLSRAKGWRKPEGAIVVSRPSKWGNPIKIVRVKLDGGWMFRVTGSALDGPAGGPAYNGLDTARHFAARHFEWDLRNGRFGDRYPSVDQIVEQLAGRDLACWCPVKFHPNGRQEHGSCHADVLLDIANIWWTPPAEHERNRG